MRTHLLKVTLACAAIGICSIAYADTTIDEVFTCQLNEGKTMDDLREVNARWVKFMNANVEGGNISGNIVTTIVGDLTPGRFLFVDSFPSLESWTAAKSATTGNAEGEAIDAVFGAVTTCTESGLYSSESS